MKGWLSRVDAVGRSDAFLTRHEATKSLKVVEKSPSNTGEGFYTQYIRLIMIEMMMMIMIEMMMMI